MPNPNEAQINVTADTFVANASNPVGGAPSGPFCPVTSLAFVLDAGGKPVDGGGQVALNGTDIAATRKGPGNAPIAIKLILGGAAGPFAAQRIVFVKSNLAGDPDGVMNLTDRSCAGAAVVFKNQWIHHGPKHGPGGNQAHAWKYYIRVQQTSSGAFGWIDPDLENQD